MHKINTVLNNSSPNSDTQFSQLVAQANSHLKLQAFWDAATPKNLSNLCTIGTLQNQKLTIYAHNASVASKIKLTSASLLNQLQSLEQNNPDFTGFKVKAISVKVQVKSQQKHAITTPRQLSSGAAATLKNLAKELGDSELARKLVKLANNA